MIGLVLMVRRVLGAFRTAWADHAFRGLALTLAALVASATLFYVLVEGWSPLDSAYFSVVTGLTIGYGDLAPQTAIGKVFTMLYALLAVGLFVGLGATLAKAYLDNRTRTRAALRQRRAKDH
ncbi:potassium channel family protein [Nocardioides limicola]|uniref:potassium channel family protein n=1 Tax=Nocardioides limicola TaxID=2803368 RepID=UPI00193AF4AC|nr:potassium channel family protein [Nocardioides sp. DJM-14]